MTLRCLWLRPRIGPYLDGALPEDRARGVASHLESCGDCRERARSQERLTALVRDAALEVTEPKWAGFWPGIRRRIVAEGPAVGRSVRQPRPASALGWFPRLAIGSAAAGLLLLGLFVWRGADHVEVLAPGIVVRTVEVSNPNTSVMVFAAPEHEMTVIWVFGLDPAMDQSLRQSVEVKRA